jgi:aspartyl-tRNA synthetase
LEYDKEAGRYVAMHHPFTSPKKEDFDLMKTDPARVRARAYDLVLNGYEIAGGSIRNYSYENQMKVFSLLKIDEAEAKEKFGFLLEALQYGAPPHGGIAFGFDRLVMILAGKKSIREVIPFPKTTSALSLMDNSPAEVDEEQLKELGLKIDIQ